MRSFIIRRQSDRRSVNWWGLAALVFLTPALVIGAVEAVWYAMTGSFSPLLAGFGLISAILIVIRIVGESIARKTYLVESLR